MKRIGTLLAVVAFSQLHAADGIHKSKNNFTAFSSNYPIITSELDSLTSNEFKSHPEYGVNPYNTPCKDCFELLQKRDETHRYFVMKGSKGKEFCQVTTYGRINYYDETGVLHAIDPRIKPSSEAGIYKADHQPMPVTINARDKFTSILNGGKELRINNNVSIYIRHSDGSESSLGEPSWADYTAGDNGMLVRNFYPGIDLELRVHEGGIESNYRINKPLNLGEGWLVVHDNINLPKDFSYDYSNTIKQGDNYEGALYISNEDGARFFLIGSPSAYDENGAAKSNIKLSYKTNDNGAYDIYVPLEWMNSTDRSYPLVIDPLVTAMPTIAIGNANYNAACFANGCAYALPVNVPAACTITDVQYSFDYQATGVCWVQNAAFDLTLGACRSPAVAGTWINCPNSFPGTCADDNLSIYNDIHACIPAPNCATYPLNFTLTFYQCTDAAETCGGAAGCIIADSPWEMDVFGRTLEVTPITTDVPSDSICVGGSVNLTATASFGVPPYTYTWNPGAFIGQTDPVTPATTTTYILTVSTCAGTVDISENVTITVVTNDNPGFTIAPNPACSGSPVAVTGLNGMGANPSNYSWTFVAGNPSSVNNEQVVTVTYPVAGGPNNITLHYTRPGTNCTFDNTQTISVLPSPQAAYIFNPADVSLLSPTVTFTDQSTNVMMPTWAWDFGDGTNSNVENPTHTYTAPGIYTVKLVVTNGSGCMDSISYTLQVLNEYFYYIPNSFTPNGDGVNHYFAPQGTDATKGIPLIYTMTIYNRWGEKIFETDNSSLPWAGQANKGSKIAEAGVYVYRIKFENSNYSSKEIVGSVTLVR